MFSLFTFVVVVLCVSVVGVREALFDFCLFVLVLASDKPLATACSCFIFVLLRCAHLFQCFCLLVKCVYLECCYTIALFLFWYLLNTRAFVLEDRDITMCLCVLV